VRKVRVYLSCVVLFASLLNTQLLFAQAERLAFPEALGFGRFTQGGSGGQIIMVNSLEDNAQTPEPGTLRYAVEQKGPRIVVFNVSGVIKLEDQLTFSHPYITIAGQTSPGGIVVTGANTRINTDQVIIRYIRFRLGSSVADEDAITARNTSHVMIDHCSLSWGVDETASFYNNRFFTLQYSLITESLNNAGHAKGEHGYGGIWGGSGASFIKNVVAHHTSRLPRINGYRLKPRYAQADSYVEMVNNVIYNWRQKSSYGGENGRFNLVNNYYKQGPVAGPDRIFEFFPVKTKVNHTQAFFSGNFFEANTPISQDNLSGIKFPSVTKQDEINRVLQDKPVTPLHTSDMSYLLQADSAKQAFSELIYQKEVGANRNQSGSFIDSVDSRILAEIKDGKADKGKQGIIDTEADSIASWAEYRAEFSQFKPYQDDNKDGIADDWLVKYEGSLDKTQPVIEQYINSLGAF